MEKRLQTIEGDTILEITEDQPVKRRLSEKTLRRQKAYLEQSIAAFQQTLDEVNGLLEMITTEKNAARDTM